jgi:hypothetical protein
MAVMSLMSAARCRPDDDRGSHVISAKWVFEHNAEKACPGRDPGCEAVFG